jgi:hypothetical protein
VTKTIIGYSIVTHYDDKSTETTKIPGDRLVLQVGGSQSKYTYINADECPVHGPWRAVPAGSKNGKTWDAFWSCDVARDDPRCTNRPSKEWVETHPAEDFDSLPF